MIEIRHRHTGKVIYKSSAATIKDAVEEAVKKGVSLSCVDLKGADLRGLMTIEDKKEEGTAEDAAKFWNLKREAVRLCWPGEDEYLIWLGTQKNKIALLELFIADKRALFGDVKKGDIGGLVESEYNLSHEGRCWIYDEA